MLHAGYRELRSVLDVARHRNARPRSEAWRRQPLLLWRAQLAGWLFRPRPAILRSAMAAAAAVGWSLPPPRPGRQGAPQQLVIGVHVRRGDKAAEAAHHPWRRYHAAVEACARRLHRGRGRRTVLVYLSSDTATAGVEARRWRASAAGGGGWVVRSAQGGQIVLQLAVAPDGQATAAGAQPQALLDAAASVHVTQTHEFNVSEYAHQGMRAAWLLSEVDCLVSSFSSNLGRLAYELMVAKRGIAAAQAISLDLPWYAQP